MTLPEPADARNAAFTALELRLGHLYVRQRLGLERDHEVRVTQRSKHPLHIKNWYSLRTLIRASLWLVGLRRRAQRNALAIGLRENDVTIAGLPPAFDGYTILHLSDLHPDISASFTDALLRSIHALRYDLCVLTGDYRALTYGPIGPALAELSRLRPHIESPAYAILGNHDSLRMVPPWSRWATECC